MINASAGFGKNIPDVVAKEAPPIIANLVNLRLLMLIVTVCDLEMRK
jgi:hypothetical protein